MTDQEEDGARGHALLDAGMIGLFGPVIEREAC